MAVSDEGVYILFKHLDFWYAFHGNSLMEIITHPQNVNSEKQRIMIRDTEIDAIHLNSLWENTQAMVPLSQANVLVLNGDHGRIGLVIDHVEEVFNLRKSQIYPIIPLIMKKNHNMFLGITSIKQKTVTVLDYMVLYQACFEKGSCSHKEVLDGK